MAVGTGLQSRPGPGPAEGIPCPHHDSLPRPPAWPGRAPAPHQTTSPRWCYTLTPRGLHRPPLLRTSWNVCSQLLMPCQSHLGTVPCSAPPPPTCPLTLLPQSFCIPFTAGDSCLPVARGPLEAHLLDWGGRGETGTLVLGFKRVGTIG
uniref:Uncharacterized protein n=1 Tax=Rousettus aegyptiacus TaxID=9407 RepID=A0A7J8IM43_ROUAE|nr:hypothetical protein HJG63_010779 [Rousettus aegyptiacus]